MVENLDAGPELAAPEAERQTAALLPAEDEMRKPGRSRLGLHVFGRNTGAQRLYTRLGYGIHQQIWQRPAIPDPSPAIEVRPLPAGDGTARAAYAGDRRVGSSCRRRGSG